MLNGITLVVTGHAYYGRFAYNLAVSIKAVEDFPIALLYTKSAITHLSTKQIDIFDKFVELPEDAPKNSSCKLLAGKYTPWENTLLIDVDTIWLPNKKPSQVFELLKNVQFTGITEGKKSDPAKFYFFWADINEICEKYSFITEIYQWRTEFLYFGKEGRCVLNRAYEICNNPGLSSIKMHGNGVPDELGVNIAAAELGFEPHTYKWKCSFWHLLHGNYIPTLSELYDNYYILSMGSNFNSSAIKIMYNNLMRSYCTRLGVQHVFDIVNKRNFLTERAKN